MRSTIRSGFTLAEVLVSLALVAVLGAVIVPTVRGRMQDAYEDSIVAEFENLQSAILAYRQDVGHYPPRLDYLSALPASPVNFCGDGLTTAEQNNWRGPYVTRAIPAQTFYLLGQKDSVLDVLVAKGSPNPTGIGIQLKGPDTLTAHNVDLKITGSSNGGVAGNNNQVPWTTTSSDVILTFIIPTKSNPC